MRAARLAVQCRRKTREILISPRRRNAESGMNQQHGLAAQRREKIQRLDFFAATGGKRRLVLEEKRHVRAERRGEFIQLRGGKRLAKQFVQREQRGRGIAAAAAQTGGQRNFFLQMNAHPVADFRGLQKPGGGAMNQIARIRRQGGVAARQFDRTAAAFKRQPVAKIDRLHDGFEFVKSVGPFAEDVQQQVDFGGRIFSERHGLHKNKTRQREMVGAPMKADRVTVNCRTP